MQRTLFRHKFLAAAVLALPVLLATPAHAALMNQRVIDPEPTRAAPLPMQHEVPMHFAKVIEDLPLMPGLELVEEEDVLFTAPGAGRIAETNAIGAVDVDAVYNFYRKSLPHLGWKMATARTYRREREELRIDAHANQKITVVRFTVRPFASR